MDRPNDGNKILATHFQPKVMPSTQVINM